MGDIGKEVHEIEVLPVEEPARRSPEPQPATTPAPEREPEKVPA